MSRGATASLPEIWVVVPASRPQHSERVLDQFHAQTYGHKKLLVVENGDAVGSYSGLGVDVLLDSIPHQSAAKNRALDHLRKHQPEALVAFWDDDDRYGDHYLSEQALLARNGTIWAKRETWVEFPTGLVWFGHNWKPGDDAEYVSGATISGYVQDMPNFPITPCAEEQGFVKRAKANGVRVRHSTRRGFVYDRTSALCDHTYKAREEKVWRHSGKGIRVAGTWRDWIESDPPYGPVDRYRKQCSD